MAESDRGHAWLLKAVIVLLVFPVLLLTLMQPWKLVLYPLASILPAEALWAQIVGWAAMIVGLMFAIGGAFWVCRLIWPRRATNHNA
jgi:hypothetical protein